MEFLVKFYAEDGKNVACAEAQYPGLRLLQAARALVPGIDPAKVSDCITQKDWQDCEIKIPEKIALAANIANGLFWKNRVVNVEVPARALNKYIRVKPRVKGDRVELEHMISREVIDDWVAAGFPLKWDPR
jgi:hypothetical protein